MSIKDFHILNELGKGSFGSVYKVERIQDKVIYALKIVDMSRLNDKEKENSLNEVRILASVDSENVVSYKDAFYDYKTNSLCIVMEYADDGDLEIKINNYLKNKKVFEENEIWKIFQGIAKGLKALHDKKIMHRDLKCANIFLNKNNGVKIGDMNVSKVLKLGLLSTQTGTPYYASPEVWSDKPYDYKSDIWSLGCILYEMCTGNPPFRGNNMEQVYTKVIKGSFDPINSIFSKDLKFLVSSLLQVKPKNRPNIDEVINIVLSASNEKKNSRNINNNCTFQDQMLNTIKLPKDISEINNIMPKAKYSLNNRNIKSSITKRNNEINNKAEYLKEDNFDGVYENFKENENKEKNLKKNKSSNFIHKIYENDNKENNNKEKNNKENDYYEKKITENYNYSEKIKITTNSNILNTKSNNTQNYSSFFYENDSSANYNSKNNSKENLYNFSNLYSEKNVTPKSSRKKGNYSEHNLENHLSNLNFSKDSLNNNCNTKNISKIISEILDENNNIKNISENKLKNSLSTNSIIDKRPEKSDINQNANTNKNQSINKTKLLSHLRASSARINKISISKSDNKTEKSLFNNNQIKNLNFDINKKEPMKLFNRNTNSESNSNKNLTEQNNLKKKINQKKITKEEDSKVFFSNPSTKNDKEIIKNYNTNNNTKIIKNLDFKGPDISINNLEENKINNPPKILENTKKQSYEKEILENTNKTKEINKNFYKIPTQNIYIEKNKIQDENNVVNNNIRNKSKKITNADAKEIIKNFKQDLQNDENLKNVDRMLRQQERLYRNFSHILNDVNYTKVEPSRIENDKTLNEKRIKEIKKNEKEINYNTDNLSKINIQNSIRYENLNIDQKKKLSQKKDFILINNTSEQQQLNKINKSQIKENIENNKSTKIKKLNHLEKKNYICEYTNKTLNEKLEIKQGINKEFNDDSLDNYINYQIENNIMQTDADIDTIQGIEAKLGDDLINNKNNLKEEISRRHSAGKSIINYKNLSNKNNNENILNPLKNIDIYNTDTKEIINFKKLLPPRKNSRINEINSSQGEKTNTIRNNNIILVNNKNSENLYSKENISNIILSNEIFLNKLETEFNLEKRKKKENNNSSNEKYLIKGYLPVISEGNIINIKNKLPNLILPINRNSTKVVKEKFSISCSPKKIEENNVNYNHTGNNLNSQYESNNYVYYNQITEDIINSNGDLINEKNNLQTIRKRILKPISLNKNNK